MEKVGITIVGAGIIGLSIAREVSGKSDSVYLLEKHDSFGRETSSRNSEVIHAGIYYPEGSLKARTCVEGNRMIYDISEEYGIPHKMSGKLIIAECDAEIADLERLVENGRANGVEDLDILSRNEVKELEPNIEAKAAIYSKRTGVVDSHRLMEFYSRKAKDNGVSLTYKTEVTGIKKSQRGYKVSVIDSGGGSFTFETEIFINCAGLLSDHIAGMVGMDIARAGYELKYCKGQYFKLTCEKSKLVSRLIYPVPRSGSGGLGVHVTPNLAGIVRLGPDEEYIAKADAGYGIDEWRRMDFYESCRNFLPFIDPEDLSPDTSGIRSKLQGPGEPFRDFIIKEEKDAGLPGFINLIGIESPGLTAAPSIAKLVSSLI